MDIQVIACEIDISYIQAILYMDGKEIGCTDPSLILNDTFTINNYTVSVKEKID